MSAEGTTVGRISIKVSPDTKEFRRELQRELKDIEKSMKGDVEIKGHFGGAQAKADFDRMMAQMKAQAAKGVQVKVGVDKSPAAPMLPSLGGAGGGAAPAAGLAGSIGPIAIMGAVLAAAAPAAAILSGALAALPGLLAGVVAPIAAISLGLDGIKQAASTLQAPFDQLKASVSDVFAQALGPIFEQLKSVFPTLTAGLQQIAAGASTAFGGIVNALTSGDGLKSLSTTFQNIGAAIAASAPGLESFTGGLLKMASSFSSLFPQMAGVFNSLGASFGNWVTQITTANSQGVSPLQTALTNLGTIAGTIGPILGDVFSKGFKLLQDPTFIQNVKSIMTTIGGLVNVVMTVSSAFASLATPVTIVIDAFKNMGSYIQAIPGIISAAFSTAVAAVSSAGSSIASAISNAFGSLVGIVQGAWDQAVSAVRSGVSNAVSATAELGSQIVSACGNFAGLLVQAGKDLIQGLINGIKSMASAAWDAVTSVASGAVNKAKSILGIQSPSTVFHGIGVNIGQGLSNGIEGMTDTLKGQMADLANSMLETFQKNISGEFTKAFGDEMKNVVSGSGDNAPAAGGKIDWQSKQSEYAKTLAEMPVDLAMANVKQAQQDLGMSGGGALGALMDYGVGFGKQALGNVFNFNTSNVDDTIAVHNNVINRQAQGVVGR